MNNKKHLIFSSLLILLPIPLGYALRHQLPTEFVSSFFWMVWLLPLSLLGAQWLCIFMTKLDKGNKNRNRKPLSLVLWIIPLIGNLCFGIMYALYLGLDFSPTAWMIIPMGLMFAVIGNYLPKTKMNSTMGIKVKWAYSSEANWNATHRFAGRLWVAGGILVAASAFLPEEAAIIAMILLIVVLSVVPMWYSWKFYQKEYAEGKVEKANYSKLDRRILKFSQVFLVLLTVFVLSIMFTGDLEYSFEADSLTIQADWYADFSLRYDAIEAVEFREGNVPGIRVGGFGSGRLLMGFFQNDEFGTYTRYTYHNPDACVVLTVKGKTLVLSGKTEEESTAIYQELMLRTEK